MDCRLNITTLYSGAGKFDLSNKSAVHASSPCAGIEGFLVYRQEETHTVPPITYISEIRFGRSIGMGPRHAFLPFFIGQFMRFLLPKELQRCIKAMYSIDWPFLYVSGLSVYSAGPELKKATIRDLCIVAVLFVS